MSDVREEVRERYAEAARSVSEGKVADDWHPEVACCGPECCAPDEGLGVQLYDAAEREDLPDEAVLASLGCGNPTAVADLREGETVLDLGSGGGIDGLLSAPRGGPAGQGYGLDNAAGGAATSDGSAGRCRSRSIGRSSPGPGSRTSRSSRPTSWSTRCTGRSFGRANSNRLPRAGAVSSETPEVLFVCVHNAG